MVAYAKQRRLGGIVIHGAIRDAAAIRGGSFPIFASGVTHRGPYKDGPGEINVPIAIDGMVVRPGDLVLGDDDGLVCVPLRDAEAVYEATAAKHAAEEAQMAAIKAGRNDRAGWMQRCTSAGPKSWADLVVPSTTHHMRRLIPRRAHGSFQGPAWAVCSMCGAGP